MILYCDSSALVKKYMPEPKSQECIALMRQAEAIVISVVGYAEILAAFHRKLESKEISAGNFSKACLSFEHDWKALMKVNITHEINKTVRQVLSKHALRGFDAIHLSSAILMEKRLKDVSFLSFDEKQKKAAASERLEILHP